MTWRPETRIKLHPNTKKKLKTKPEAPIAKSHVIEKKTVTFPFFPQSLLKWPLETTDASRRPSWNSNLPTQVSDGPADTVVQDALLVVFADSLLVPKHKLCAQVAPFLPPQFPPAASYSSRRWGLNPMGYSKPFALQHHIFNRLHFQFITSAVHDDKGQDVL